MIFNAAMQDYHMYECRVAVFLQVCNAAPVAVVQERAFVCVCGTTILGV